jgi:hypothetical protein
MNRTVGIVAGLFITNLLAYLLLADTAAQRLGQIVPQVFVAAAALAVAGHLSMGDRPRRPWLVLALGALVLISARVVSWLLPEGFSHEIVLMAANLLFVVGVADILSMIRSSPLVLPLAPRMKVMVGIAAGIASLAALLAVLIFAVRMIDAGWSGAVDDWTRLAAIVGLFCDAAVFVICLYIAASVLPLAGGLAARPYLLISVSGAAFLMLDLIGIFVVDNFGYGGFGQWMRYAVLLAWALYAAAGVEQMLVLRFARRE